MLNFEIINKYNIVKYNSIICGITWKNKPRVYHAFPTSFQPYFLKSAMVHFQCLGWLMRRSSLYILFLLIQSYLWSTLPYSLRFTVQLYTVDLWIHSLYIPAIEFTWWDLHDFRISGSINNLARYSVNGSHECTLNILLMIWERTGSIDQSMPD